MTAPANVEAPPRPRLDRLRRWPWSTVARHAVVALATLFVVRVVGAGWSGGFPIFFPDSSSFLSVAGRGPLTGRFWFDERPVGFPLLAWALGRSVRLIVLAQTVLYITSFAVLVLVVVRSVRSTAARVVAALLLAGIATQPRFALWNTHVLSESLSISLGVLTVAGWWWFAAAPVSRRLAWAMLATTAWLVTRDSNLAPVLAVAVPTMLVAARWWGTAPPSVRRGLAMSAGGLVLVGAYLFVAQDVSDRNRYPVMNNIGQRVLPDAAMTDWFVDRGMPMSDRLRSLAGRSSFDEDGAMLNDPELADFRAWADGSGQRVQAMSFVLRAGFWLDRIGDADQLPAVLATDFDDYDAFTVGDRLPTTWLGLSGPRSLGALALWSSVGIAGIAVAATRRWLRPLASVTATAMVATLLDGYLSYAGDSVEFGRHLVGPIVRATIAIALGIVLGIEFLATRRLDSRSRAPSATAGETPLTAIASDETLVSAGAVADGEGVDRLVASRRQTSSPRPPGRSTGAYVLTVLGTLLVAASIFGNELRSQNFDPQYMRVLVDRTLRYGGSFYSNGIHNKGPLEPFVYAWAHWIGGADGYWIVISVFVAIAALVVALVTAGTARIAGAGVVVAATVGGGLLVHLTLSPADYAGTLYARQITITLLTLAWGLAIVDRAWSTPRRATASALLVGLLLGLAVQTLLSAVFAGAVVAVLALAGERRRAGARPAQTWHRWVRTGGLIAGAGAVTLLLAPVYYTARGSFDEFWSGWWTYAGYSNTATGRSLAGQLGLGWDQAYAYYRRFPLSFVAVAGFGVTSYMLWNGYSRRQRQLRLGAAAWIVAAWIELALSQRYSSHYFSVLAVPTWIAFAMLAADVETIVHQRARASRHALAIPIAAAVALVYVSGATPLMDGIARASTFTSVERLAAERRNAAGPPVRAEQAVLDLVTSRGDPMLAWTMVPWTYLEHERVSATRFIWKSFLLGEIYLAGSGPQYVLPRTWEWFAEDVAEAQPLVYHEEVELPRTAGTPFAEYVDERFELAYTGTVASLWLERGVAEQVRTGNRDRRTWSPSMEPPNGWTVTDGTASWTPPTGGETGVAVPLENGWCRRIDGFVDRADFDDPQVEILVRGETGAVAGRLRLADDQATSSSESVEYDARPWSWPPTEDQTAFSVVTGDRSIVLVLEGSIVAAVPLDRDVVGPGGPLVEIVGGSTPLVLDDLTVAATGPLGTSGCS